MPADGWYQLAPLGEFVHAGAGVVQVVDTEACAAMVNRFAEEAGKANFAGLLVDFDHFSLDGEKRSEAAGWITELEKRVNSEQLTVNRSTVNGGESLATLSGIRIAFFSDLVTSASGPRIMSRQYLDLGRKSKA